MKSPVESVRAVSSVMVDVQLTITGASSTALTVSVEAEFGAATLSLSPSLLPLSTMLVIVMTLSPAVGVSSVFL